MELPAYVYTTISIGPSVGSKHKFMFALNGPCSEKSQLAEIQCNVSHATHKGHLKPKQIHNYLDPIICRFVCLLQKETK